MRMMMMMLLLRFFKSCYLGETKDVDKVCYSGRIVFFPFVLESRRGL
jgi:hypothetical protein